MSDTPNQDKNIHPIAIAKAAAKAEWNKHKAKHPELSGWELGGEIFCYKKRPPGFSRVIKEIMKHLTYPGYADKKQVEILEGIKPLFPQHNLQPTIWNKKLRKSQLETMKSYLPGNNLGSVDIQGCKTLAHIKRRIEAYLHPCNKVFYEFRRKIMMDDRAVVVDKQLYRIETRKHPSIRITIDGKRCWLRVDVLKTLLGG